MLDCVVGASSVITMLDFKKRFYGTRIGFNNYGLQISYYTIYHSENKTCRLRLRLAVSWIELVSYWTTANSRFAIRLDGPGSALRLGWRAKLKSLPLPPPLPKTQASSCNSLYWIKEINVLKTQMALENMRSGVDH